VLQDFPGQSLLQTVLELGRPSSDESSRVLMLLRIVRNQVFKVLNVCGALRRKVGAPIQVLFLA